MRLLPGKARRAYLAGERMGECFLGCRLEHRRYGFVLARLALKKPPFGR